MPDSSPLGASIRELNASFCRLTNEHLSKLPALPSLETLNLDGCQDVDDEDGCFAEPCVQPDEFDYLVRGCSGSVETICRTIWPLQQFLLCSTWDDLGFLWGGNGCYKKVLLSRTRYRHWNHGYPTGWLLIIMLYHVIFFPHVKLCYYYCFSTPLVVWTIFCWSLGKLPGFGGSRQPLSRSEILQYLLERQGWKDRESYQPLSGAAKKSKVVISFNPFSSWVRHLCIISDHWYVFHHSSHISWSYPVMSCHINIHIYIHKCSPLNSKSRTNKYSITWILLTTVSWNDIMWLCLTWIMRIYNN